MTKEERKERLREMLESVLIKNKNGDYILNDNDEISLWLLNN